MSLSNRKKFHLICNAHLDPVWLWEWEEGAAAALSTFRTAADLCEEFGRFVFCHNEVILYQWVEEYEPALFARIQRLVKEKKWHIMGGWFLQPDCNMPSGESLVRQMLTGRRYFKEKFGVVPTTAINFDPFGHTQGLVQILAKAGFDSYLFCRPAPHEIELPDRTFRWVGLDGSSVMATRVEETYLSPLGGARDKAETCMKNMAGRSQPDAILWGVGNHGGGPSRKDICDLDALIAQIKKTPDMEVCHSTPEAYFADLKKSGVTLPEFRGGLNPTMVGCYTSQVRIKQEHRALENDLYMSEKMAAAAYAAGLMTYPEAELSAAGQDLLTAEFHDIIPGSSIQAVEDASLRGMAHGREILSRVRARAFFALATGQKKAPDGSIPVCVYNPHPWPVDAMITCEFQLADQNFSGTFTDFVVKQKGKAIPAQVEKERSNLNLDWRKHVVFRAVLAPSCMNRFDCHPVIRPSKPVPTLAPKKDMLTVKTPDMSVSINTRTGFVDRWTVGGKDMVAKKAFEPVVYTDNADPWCMRSKRLGKPCGRFRLMNRKEGSAFSGLPDNNLPSVRVVEEGAARTVIEAVFAYEKSAICQRYLIPTSGTAFDVETRVFWMEKDRTLKLTVPSAFAADTYCGQIAFGAEELATNGNEVVAQKWTAMLNRDKDCVVTCINEGTYGSDFSRGAMHLTLMRSPTYSAHPIADKPLVRQDGFTERIDQGERIFRFRFDAGTVASRMSALDREALSFAEKPMAVSFFPSGAGKLPRPLVTMDRGSVVLTALKCSEDGKGFVVRLYEPMGKAGKTTLSLPALGIKKALSFSPFEIKTLWLDMKKKTLTETSLMENLLK